MSTVFKINGDIVPREEWEALRRDLPTSPKTWFALWDNTLTEEELNSILDDSCDGTIYFNDFEGWKPTRFDNINQILSRHGFRLQDKIMESSRQISSRDFPERLLSLREIILLVVKQSARELELADPKLRADREFILDAVKQNGWALKYANPSLQKDLSFLTQLALANINVLEVVRDPVLQNTVWQNIRERNNWSSLLPPENLQTYSAWKEGLKKIYDIEFICRFRSPEILYSIVALRQNLQHDPSKPFAVVNFTKSDWDGVLAQYPIMDRLTELGYQVLYYEAATEEEVQRNLAEATWNGKNKTDLIVLAGHGTSTTLSLSGRYSETDLPIDDEKLYIDTSDFDKPAPDISLQEFIKPTGDMILCSCSNGEGKETNPNNLANTSARTLPKGVTVHASDRPMAIDDISRDKDGKLIVTWTEDSLYTTKGGRE